MWRNTKGSDTDRDGGLVAAQFDADRLAEICVLPEKQFGAEFDMDKFKIRGERKGEDFYYYRDSGASVLAVAHLDTVADASKRAARFVETESGLVVHSRALDDRLGAYIILDLLPKLDIEVDVLLTVGEEMGNSTAQWFDTDKQYDHMIEFDRGGTDVVMYQYDDDEVRDLVEDADAIVGDGIFSDICYLGQLGIKGFNWGVGYRDYHGPRAHAYLVDTFEMVAKYARFHAQNEGVYMPHYGSAQKRSFWWDDLDTPSTKSITGASAGSIVDAIVDAADEGAGSEDTQDWMTLSEEVQELVSEDSRDEAAYRDWLRDWAN